MSENYTPLCERCFTRPAEATVTKFCYQCDKEAREGKELKDVTGPKVVEIDIRPDGKVVWVNTEVGCVFRACQIGTLIVKDQRPDQWLKNTWHGLKKLMRNCKQDSAAWHMYMSARVQLETMLRSVNIDLEQLRSEHEESY